ncbi:hypothetical protein N332_10676, partial [Mesitornis unicolor]
VLRTAWSKGPAESGSDSQHRNFNTELFKTSKTKSHLKKGSFSSVTWWLGWFSSRALAVGVGEAVSVLLLTNKLPLWGWCCVTVTSPGLAVGEACSVSALVPIMGVVGIDASSTSV